MSALSAGLFAAGLFLALASVVMALITRSTAAPEDLTFLHWLAGTAQTCTGAALVVLTWYGYQPASAVRGCIYAAMAAALLSFCTRIPRTAPDGG
jgi:hypothetical protein